MTTKAEFDSFVAGFKLAGHEHVSMEQLDAILAMVPSVIASEVAAATPIAATAAIDPSPVVEQPVEEQIAPAVIQPVIVQQPEPIASSPYISVPEPAPVEEWLPIVQMPVPDDATAI